MLILSVPALSVTPPVKVLVFERVSSPAPDFIKVEDPLTIEETVKSGLAAPFATVTVSVAPSDTGALIVAVVALLFALIFPASVIVPEPVIEVPVILTEPTLVTLFAPIAKIPLLTVNAFVIAIPEASVTVPPVFAMVRLATVAGSPLPTA